MLIYLIMLALPLVGSLLQPHVSEKHNNLIWLAVCGFWIFVIGFRQEVGCDWQPYLALYSSIEHQIQHFPDQVQRDNYWATQMALLYSWGIGYPILNWISALAGFGIYGVNLTCAIVVVLGLSTFCRQTSLPWFAWFLATPYLLIVVSMGFTRQSVALGFLLWGITVLQRRRFLIYTTLILIASTFHPWVFLIGTITLLPYIQWRFYTALFLLLAIVILSTAIFTLKFHSDLSLLISTVTYGGSISQGARLRVAMTTAPAIIILLLTFKAHKGSAVDPIWKVYSLLTLGAFSTVSLASTAIDRMMLYLIPLQIFGWPYIEGIISIKVYRMCLRVIIVSLYVSSFILWYEFSDHGYCWQPYLNIFL